MRYLLLITTFFYLGCDHDHAEFTLLDHTHQEYPELSHEHDFVVHEHPVPTHSHDLVRHEHNYATPTHNHPFVEHGHSELAIDIQNAESQIRSLEKFREHTHTDLFSRIVTHDHNSPKLTFDECPIPDFDLDWKGKAFFEFNGISDTDRQPSGILLLSNGRYGAMAITSSHYTFDDTTGWGRGHDYVVGGWVNSSTRIRVSYIGTDSTDGHTEDKPDGRLTANEVIKHNFENSWIRIDDDGTFLQYQLDIDEGGVFHKSSSGGTCNSGDERYAPDLIKRLLPLAKDLIEIMTKGL